jgi:hypothetical protein
MFEISNGATIEDNVVWDNGWGFATWAWGAGILISSSGNAVVRNNVVAWNADGISIVSQARGRPGGDPVTGVRVTDNVIVAGPPGGWLLTWIEDWSGGLRDPASDNRASGNRFWEDPAHAADCHYLWVDCFADVDAFATTPGGAGSTTLTDHERQTLLAAVGLEQPVEHVINDPPRTREVVRTVAIVGGIVFGAAALLIVLFVRRRRRTRRGTATEGDSDPIR